MRNHTDHFQRCQRATPAPWDSSSGTHFAYQKGGPNDRKLAFSEKNNNSFQTLLTKLTEINYNAKRRSNAHHEKGCRNASESVERRDIVSR
jgi:hypothetical protein